MKCTDHQDVVLSYPFIAAGQRKFFEDHARHTTMIQILSPSSRKGSFYFKEVTVALKFSFDSNYPHRPLLFLECFSFFTVFLRTDSPSVRLSVTMKDTSRIRSDLVRCMRWENWNVEKSLKGNTRNLPIWIRSTK